MKPFRLTVDNKLQIIVLPNSEAHVDGHPVLTYSYSLYKSHDNEKFKIRLPSLKQTEDPDYLGTILFEQPDKLFTYEPGGKNSLNSYEVEEIIEKITTYRETPAMWIV